MTAEEALTEDRPQMRIVKEMADCKTIKPGEKALVEVPGDWKNAVSALMRISEELRHGGLLVTNVGPKGQGAAAGIARGDVLLRYNGVELDSATTLRRLTRSHSRGGSAAKIAHIDSVRGQKDVTWDVGGGPLGITVSVSLHRMESQNWTRLAPNGNARQDDTMSPQHSSGDLAGTSTLVEVPGELAATVLGLVAMLRSSSAKTKKKLGALLATALIVSG